MGNCFSNDERDTSYGVETQQQRRQDNQNQNTVQLLSNPDLKHNHKVMFKNTLGVVFKGELGIKPVTVIQVHQNRKEDACRESRLLQQLDHINIVRLFFQTTDRDFLYNIYEFHKKPLEDFIQNLTGKEDIMKQMTSALYYLQNLGIVHLNLNPKTVFIVDSQCGDKIVKIASFNYHALMERASVIRLEQNRPVKGFTAPEVNNKTASLTSDNYSLGCIFFNILSKGLLLTEIKEKSHANIMVASYSKESNDHLCADLLVKLSQYRQENRMSISEALRHPLFWSSLEKISLINDVSKMIEQGKPLNSQIIKFLFFNSKNVIGDGVNDDWSNRIERPIMDEITSARQQYKSRNGNSEKDNAKKNIISLITTIRNINAHAQSPILSNEMGTPELFVNYWETKYPHLILHLYNAKQKSEK